MIRNNFMMPLPLLMAERPLTVHTFPAPYNAEVSPYSKVKEFSKILRTELKIYHKLKIRSCKVIFVGDVAVGKTTIVNRFCYDKFQAHYKATIGVDFEIENFNIMGRNFSLEMWDTAGQERFKCIAQAYYRNANVIVVVFDMSKQETLQSATAWLKSALAVNTMHKPLIFLVGTKSDLLDQDEFVRIEKLASELATKLDIQAEYWAVSARTGFNIVEFFQRLAVLAFEVSCKEALRERKCLEKSISLQMQKKSQSYGNFSKKVGSAEFFLRNSCQIFAERNFDMEDLSDFKPKNYEEPILITKSIYL